MKSPHFCLPPNSHMAIYLQQPMTPPSPGRENNELYWETWAWSYKARTFTNVLHCLYSGLWMDFLHFFYTDWKKSASLQEKDFSMNNWVVFSDILRWMETHGFEVIIQQKCVNLLICLMQNSLYNCHQFLENESYDLAILWGHRGKMGQAEPWVFHSFSDSDSSLEKSCGSFGTKDQNLISVPCRLFSQPWLESPDVKLIRSRPSASPMIDVWTTSLL